MTTEETVVFLRQEWYRAVEVANSARSMSTTDKEVFCNKCEKEWAAQRAAWKIIYDAMINLGNKNE